MSIERSSLVLSVTGPFGSGCTTLATALKDFGYTRISLSAGIRELMGMSVGHDPDRRALQDFGNDQRRKNGANFWARYGVQEADKLPQPTKIVFDGIRNAAEVEFLRACFPHFYLITVWCPKKIRWERIKSQYNGNNNQFEEDDKRDSNEDCEYGQQVQLCVDKADIVIRNDKDQNPSSGAVRFLKQRVEEYIDLINGTAVRPPHHDEVAMAIAYTAAFRSQCLKRTVGAAITNRKCMILSTGFNENPEPMEPCIRKFTYCYKDMHVKDHIKIMVEKRKTCPFCSSPIESFESVAADFKCQTCSGNLVRAYAPDRGMSRCTAIHAENMAIMNGLGTSLRDAILYTTTFPCSQCARQITYAGIKKVVYIEAYPDPDSEAFLRDFAGVAVEMFEGVKARAYERTFSRIREHNEKKYPLP